MLALHASFLQSITVAMAFEKPTPPEVDLINKALARHGVPGASIAVIKNHECTWAAGFGVREKSGSQKVDEDTVFQAASMSKPVCALAAMQLVERKELDLDQNVNLALRIWQVPASRLAEDEPVTLRRLLSHSAGISVHGFAGYPAGSPLPSLFQILQGQPPANSSPIQIELRPSTQFQYSGGGYCIVQQLLIDVKQQPFTEIMNGLVLKPCGMTHSSFAQPVTGPLTNNRAAGHRQGGGAIKGGAHVYPEQAAAGLWTTAADYARLLLCMDQAFLGKNSPFSKSTVEEMAKAQTGGYGLGWELGTSDGATTISHGGANEGFRCLAWLCPARGEGIVVLTNSDDGDGFIADIAALLPGPRQK